MKSLFLACLIAGSLMFVTAQEPYKPGCNRVFLCKCRLRAMPWKCVQPTDKTQR